MYDIVVVGGGPAGLTAAVYGLRNNKKVMLIEKNVFGGQIVNSPKVENIPGFTSISGDEFADNFLNQLMAQGGEVAFGEVKEVKKENDLFTVKTAEGQSYESRAVILATGTTHRLLGLEGEENLIGSGISFCAVCDGDYYKNKTVCMIGGGNSAFVEAELLSSIVSKLIILQDMPYFTADQKLQNSLLSKENIEAHVNTKVLSYVVENSELKGVRYKENGEERTVYCDGVFLAVGLIPDNEYFKELVTLDDRGYFKSDETMTTKTPGLFVAGDARAKTLRQVTTACGDGAIAAIAACNYLGYGK